MAWRIVKQPDGLYARFSEIVDDFTHIKMTREEAIELCTELAGRVVAQKKVANADKCPERYKEALDIIRRVHGTEDQESLACSICGSANHVEKMEDPYQKEMFDESVFRNLCPECAQNLRDDV